VKKETFKNSLFFLFGMVVLQDRSKRKPTGGRNTSTRPRRLHQAGRRPTLPRLGRERPSRTGAGLP
jgi:ribosomal protein S8E